MNNNDTTTNREFPREVVISPGYGAGLSTWWSRPKNTDVYDIVESRVLIDACRGLKTWEEAVDLLAEAGFDEEDVRDLGDTGGWVDSVVAVAYGPYRIVEYDGSEHIEEREDIRWRT